MTGVSSWYASGTLSSRHILNVGFHNMMFGVFLKVHPLTYMKCGFLQPWKPCSTFFRLNNEVADLVLWLAYHWVCLISLRHSKLKAMIVYTHIWFSGLPSYCENPNLIYVRGCTYLSKKTHSSYGENPHLIHVRGFTFQKNPTLICRIC